MVLTDEMLAHAEQLDREASTGPWFQWASAIAGDRRVDARFIGEARWMLPELVAEVRRLRAEVARQDSSMEQCTECASRERLEKAHDF